MTTCGEGLRPQTEYLKVFEPKRVVETIFLISKTRVDRIKHWSKAFKKKIAQYHSNNTHKLLKLRIILCTFIGYITTNYQ